MSTAVVDVAVDSSSPVSILTDGEWRPSSSAGSVEVKAPSTDLMFARIARGGADEVDAAVAAARRAFEDGERGKLTAVERGRLLMRLGELIQDDAEEIARLEAKDTDKPLKQARADMVAAARHFDIFRNQDRRDQARLRREL